MTKEEKIKEAWCNQNLDEIDGNGWVNIGYCVNGLDDVECWLSDNFFKRKLDKWEISYSELDNGEFINTRIRPKSLEGIEHNEGWIKIESEEDLPKESGHFWVCNKINNQIEVDYIDWDYESHAERWMEFNSHYQPIEKTKPPIY